MRKPKLRVGICTGGGDCPGLNTAIRAAVRHGVGSFGMELIGIRDGLTGLTGRNHLALSLSSVQGIQELGGTILGTNNKGNPFRDEKAADKTIRGIKTGWKRLKLDALIVIGGDGSQFMAKTLVSEGLHLVGVPKTIDNDLVGTELTIGFATAVEIATEAASRLNSSADAHSRIMILEVMGRDAGHIALATGIAAGANAVLIPEIPFSLAELERRFLARRKAGRDAFLIVCAEGARAEGGMPTFQEAATGVKLLGGVGQQVARALHQRTAADARVAVLGHVQRGGAANAADRILATTLATAAVELVHAGEFGRIVGIKAGKVIYFPYRTLTATRRLVDLKSSEVRAAEATGICLGRASAYQGQL